MELERNGHTVEGLVMNELPPFRVYPEEALRIAERGHMLDDFAEEQEIDVQVSDPVETAGTSTRKRSVSMKPRSTSTRAYKSENQARRTAATTVAKPSPVRHPLDRSTSSNIGGSRSGVAADWVPPETYTPPKNANWDDVVLPVVAKKLGIGVNENQEGQDGDLAVEWDKNGNPIRWIKSGGLNTSTTCAEVS